jgi:hypothetical protein
MPQLPAPPRTPIITWCHRKSIELKLLWKKTCGKTTTEVGRHQLRLLIDLTQGIDKWRALVNEVMIFRVPYNADDFGLAEELLVFKDSAPCSL